MNQSCAILQTPQRIHGAEGCFTAEFTAESSSWSGRSPADTGSRITVRVPRGRVKVPMRLVESTHYSDAALNVYMKVKALGLRLEGCTAGVATLAAYLGCSASTVQRGLAQLRAPAPDGVVELPVSKRRSLPGGRGTTANRRVRPLRPTERFIWLPVAASEHLRPRLLRAYAVIAYAVVQKIPLTERVLAGFLRHHSGRRAQTPISTEAAGRIIDELVAAGWISVRRRAALQGRHEFIVHDQPVPASRVPDDRSGPDVDARSLAYKEDLKTDRPENDAPPASSAAGEVPVDRRAEAAPQTPGPRTGGVLALRADGTTPDPSPARPRPYRGPRLTFSGRLHAVLEPVCFLLGSVNTYVQRRIGREIARQLDDGTAVARLRERLTRRLAQTFLADIRDMGRWLLGVALPRWGCADPDCETGVLWSTGARCRACREVVADRAADRRGSTPLPGDEAAGATGGPGVSRSAALAPPPSRRTVVCCPGCERPHRPGQSGPCRACRPAPAPAASATSAAPAGDGRCPGNSGTCGRPAPHGLCLRCRMASEAGPANGPSQGGSGRDLQERPARVGSDTALASEPASAGAAGPEPASAGAAATTVLPASAASDTGTSYAALTSRRSFQRW